MRALRCGVVLTLVGVALAQDPPVPPPPPPAPQPAAPAVPEVTFRGEISGVTTWSGRVRVTGDVEVPEKAALVIKAGTEVIIEGSDASHAGWNPGLVEFHVKGRLRIEGEVQAPVTIGPADMATSATMLMTTQQPAQWHGIVLYSRTQRAEDRNTIRGAVFAHAFAAVQVPDESPLIEDSVFLRCDVGVEAGSAYKSRTEAGLSPRAGCPEINRCRFAQCITGIYAQGVARPDVYRSIFYRCGHAVGNRRPGITYTLHPPGVSVVHCALLHNHIAAAGSVLSRDSIFAGNDRAVLLSGFHAMFGTNIDGMSIRQSLFHGNASDIEGDLGMAADLLRGDPAFLGPMEALLALGPPLPPCLDLGSGSAARGKATGDRDLGPMVSVPADAAAVSWRPGGAPVVEWLGAPVTDTPATAWRAAKELHRGERFGKSHWAAAEVSEGRLDLRATFGNDRAGWLGTRFTSEQAGEVMLEVNGDLEAVELSCNGAPPVKVNQRRRFSERGAAFPIKVKAGPNALVLFVRGFGASPRLAVSMTGTFEGIADPPTGEIGYASARVFTLKGDRFVDATFSPGLHWDNAVRSDAVAVRHVDLGAVGQLAVQVVGLDKLRIGPLPKEWAKGSVELDLIGVRDLNGKPAGGQRKVTVKL